MTVSRRLGPFAKPSASGRPLRTPDGRSRRTFIDDRPSARRAFSTSPEILFRPEERYLEGKFGDAYRAYCAEAPRWLSTRRLFGAFQARP
jgi:hypothetical protein